MPHLEGIGKLVHWHTGFTPCSFPELGTILIGRFVIVIATFLFGFEVEVGRVVEDFLRLPDCIVGCILIGAQCRHFLVHNKLYEYSKKKRQSLNLGTTLVHRIDLPLPLERFLLPFDELPCLQQLLVRTIPSQSHQLQVLPSLLSRALQYSLQ